jgi:hypothetical protein
MKVRSFVAAAFGVALLAGVTACAPHAPYEPPPDPISIGDCFNKVEPVFGPLGPFFPSFQYLGPANSAGNANVYTAPGCPTGGGLTSLWVGVVFAEDQVAAQDKCAAIGGFAIQMSAEGWVSTTSGANISDRVWRC